MITAIQSIAIVIFIRTTTCTSKLYVFVTLKAISEIGVQANSIAMNEIVIYFIQVFYFCFCFVSLFVQWKSNGMIRNQYQRLISNQSAKIMKIIDFNGILII